MLGVKVQLALVFADLMYGAWHHMQHSFKWIYDITNHAYHHQFRYPLAREGTWLGFLDLWISSATIGRWNIVAASMIMGNITPFELYLMIAFVHEMNCCDHSGKVMPFHSGVPFCPPLSKWLGFDKSVESHEAHHNLNKFSYGLIGLYDRIAGTARQAK